MIGLFGLPQSGHAVFLTSFIAYQNTMIQDIRQKLEVYLNKTADPLKYPLKQTPLYNFHLIHLETDRTWIDQCIKQHNQR